MTKIVLMCPNFGSRYIIIDQDHKLIFAKLRHLVRHINELKILSYFNAVILHDDNAYIALYTKQGQEFAQTVNC